MTLTAILCISLCRQGLREGIAVDRVTELICRVSDRATSEDIQSWSFGAVVRPRLTSPVPWELRRGSLDDEAIFGPTIDYQCACEKYRGPQYAEAICDVCGVKVTTRASRLERFGHINLTVAIPHDFCGGSDQIECFPVLPALFRDSQEGGELNGLYENMLQASCEHDRHALEAIYRELCCSLAPIVGAAIGWNLPNAAMLAKGMALLLKRV